MTNAAQTTLNDERIAEAEPARASWRFNLRSSILDPLRAFLTLPLFLKELTEASSRRRTYVVRTFYAGTLFLLAILFARDQLFPTGDPFAVLGRGGELYITVMLIQFGGVYLFLPALTAGSITAEKERNTLGLLLLTKLSPTKIVLEKFLGRVFPMLCLMLLSLPLLGVAYSLGGLDSELLFEGFLRLVATILMIGAIGVACSAWCRTTAGAFLLTYAVLAALFPGPAILWEVLQGTSLEFITDGYEAALIQVRLAPDANIRDFGPGLFFGPLLLIYWLQVSQNMGAFGGAFLSRSVWLIVWQATPLLFVTVVALVVARLSLVPRAEVKPKRYLARAFAALDSRFRELNDRYALGIEIVKTKGSLPEYAPIAWRETTKTNLGSMRYLIRMLLLIQTPVIFIGAIAAGSYNGYDSGMLGMMACLLWLAGGLLTAVKGAGLFAGERARQSLDVLLTTPISTRSILRQKLSGVWRLIAVLSVPIMTAWWLVGYMRYSMSDLITAEFLLFLLVASTVTLTHLALPAFLALYVGLRVPTQSRALLTSVAILVALCITGPLLHLVSEGANSRSGFSLVSLYSPAAVIGELIGPSLEPEELIALLIGNSIVYGGMAAVLLLASFGEAPRLLGRAENEPIPLATEKAQRRQPAEAV